MMRLRSRGWQNAVRGSVALLIVLAALLVASRVLAEPEEGMPMDSGSRFGVTWWTLDGGGGVSSSPGGQYGLEGTVGQPDAGALAGQLYGLRGGFWGYEASGSPGPGFRVYLPLLLR